MPSVRRCLGSDRLARPGALARVQTIKRHGAAGQHEDNNDNRNRVLAAQGIILRCSVGIVSGGQGSQFREVSMTSALSGRSRFPG